MTYLEETYYHRLNPSQGFGFQRVFTEDGELDETMAVADGDVVLVPRGPTPAPPLTVLTCITLTSWPRRAATGGFKTTPTMTGYSSAINRH